jgi:hypothetical protein
VLTCMNAYSPRNRLLLAVPPRSLKELVADLELVRCQSDEILGRGQELGNPAQVRELTTTASKKTAVGRKLRS